MFREPYALDNVQRLPALGKESGVKFAISTTTTISSTTSPGSAMSLDSGVAPRVDLVWHNTLYNLSVGTHGSDHAMRENV